MISIVETFFGNWKDYGERTNRSVFSTTESQLTPVIDKDNILIRDEGIGTAKNDYESRG
jgi:hypothetical protein